VGRTAAELITINSRQRVSTHYFHLMKNSIAVKTGDAVVAGQLLGPGGSSGNDRTAPSLCGTHFGATVEPMYTPTDYSPSVRIPGGPADDHSGMLVTNAIPSDANSKSGREQLCFPTAVAPRPYLVFYVTELSSSEQDRFEGIPSGWHAQWLG